VTSFFEIKGAFFAFFSKTTRRICALGQNTYLLQLALKNNEPGF